MIFTSPDFEFSSVQTGDGWVPQALVQMISDNRFLPSSDLTETDDLQALLETSSQVSENKKDVAEPQEWTKKLEEKFYRLAERKALRQVNMNERVEFEKLSALRRQLKNPRTGVEVLAEYEQRMLTRKLVESLTQYVEFHRQHSSHNSG